MKGFSTPDTQLSTDSSRRSTAVYALPAAFVAVAVAVVIVYGGTLQVPWYFDDLPNIVNSAIVRDLPAAFHRFFSPRGPGMLSFALNYRFGGLSLPGYHLVNICIHLAAGWTVLLLLRRFFAGTVLPLLGALIFVVHPVQTQAVTYTVQRFTSMSALFLLLSLYLFVRCGEMREAGRGGATLPHLATYAGCLLCGGLAVLTKQNAAVLPLLLFLCDRYLAVSPRRSLKGAVWYLLPFLLAGLAFGGYGLLNALWHHTPITVVSSAANQLTEAERSPLHYLVTEFTVLLVYVRMLIAPYGLALDHAWPPVERLLTLSNGLALAGILALLAVAYGLRRRNRAVSCGIFWFFIALAVESTLIPLDPMVDHRLYLPMFGYCLVVCGLLELLPQRIAVAAGLVLVVGYGAAAWQRNVLWNDPAAFYADNLRTVPESWQARNALAVIAIRHGDLKRAKRLLEEAIAINSHVAELFDNLGTADHLLGDIPDALEQYRRAIGVGLHYSPSYTNMGAVYADLGNWGEAERLHRQALRENPDNARAWYNLGVALYNLQRKPAALDAFRRAADLTPDDGDVLFNLGEVSAELGDRQTAEGALVRLQGVNGRLAAELAGRLAALRRP